MLKTAHPIIVVCGLRNSSVARIAGILGKRSNALFLPELNLFLADNLNALQVMFQRSQDGSGDGLLRAIAAIKFGEQSSEAVAQAKDWLWRRGDWSCNDLLRQLAKDCYPQQLIIPDLMLGWRPNYVSRLGRLEDFRLIHLLRHPIQHCHEVAATLSLEGFVAPEWKDFNLDPIGVIDPQIAWFRFHKNLLTLSSADSRCQLLKLEDIQANPQQAFTMLAHWLAWDDAPNQAQTIDSVFLRTGPENAPMGLEKEVMMSPQLTLELRPNPPLHSALPWRKNRRALCDEVIELAQGLGY